MLSSVFDASAVCDGAGRFRDCTPHFNQLLGGRDLSTSQLWELGATPEESDRLMTFLRHAVENATHCAVTVQASIKGTVDIIDVKLFAVLLPNRAEQENTQQLFVGVQTQERARCHPHHVPDLLESPSQWNSEAELPGREAAEEEIALSEFSQSSLPNSRTGYLCSTRPQALPPTDGSHYASSLAYTSITEMTDGLESELSALQKPRKSGVVTASTAVQTGDESKPPTADANIATDGILDEFTCQRCASRPPRIPANSIRLQRCINAAACIATDSDAAVASDASSSSESLAGSAGSFNRRRRDRRQRVSDQEVRFTSFAHQFESTPAHVCAKVLERSMKRWNVPPALSVSRCCAFHAQLTGVGELIKHMSVQIRCKPSWTIYASWQCGQCKCTNSEEDFECPQCSDALDDTDEEQSEGDVQN